MGGSDKRAAVDRLGPSEIIEKEIDGMDMNQIRPLDMADYGRGNGIARRAEIGNPYDLNSVEGLGRGKPLPVRSIEQPVQGHDAHAVAGTHLRRSKLVHDIFQSTDPGVELPHDMDDEHLKLRLDHAQTDTKVLSAFTASDSSGSILRLSSSSISASGRKLRSFAEITVTGNGQGSASRGSSCGRPPSAPGM